MSQICDYFIMQSGPVFHPVVLFFPGRPYSWAFQQRLLAYKVDQVGCTFKASKRLYSFNSTQLTLGDDCCSVMLKAIGKKQALAGGQTFSGLL